MSTSTKHPNTIRHGGPGASHENARQPAPVKKPPSDEDGGRSKISGGGGERDYHHTHEEKLKGGKVAKGD